MRWRSCSRFRRDGLSSCRTKSRFLLQSRVKSQSRCHSRLPPTFLDTYARPSSASSTSTLPPARPRQVIIHPSESSTSRFSTRLRLSLNRLVASSPIPLPLPTTSPIPTLPRAAETANPHRHRTSSPSHPATPSRTTFPPSFPQSRTLSMSSRRPKSSPLRRGSKRRRRRNSRRTMRRRVGEVEVAVDEVEGEEEVRVARAEEDAEGAAEAGEGEADLRKKAVRGRSSCRDGRARHQDRLSASSTTRPARTAQEPKTYGKPGGRS